MVISTAGSKTHWNYYLALEQDMETLSRYIEFSESNFRVYSIELAHLLFAAASEVDVLAKLLCRLVAPTMERTNIDKYREALTPAIPELPSAEVFVERYGLSFKPWKSWGTHTGADKNPRWWRSYNNVKHERDSHFHEATLQHALNALGALLVMNFHYYARVLAAPEAAVLSPVETMLKLRPQSRLLTLSPDHYNAW